MTGVIRKHGKTILLATVIVVLVAMLTATVVAYALHVKRHKCVVVPKEVDEKQWNELLSQIELDLDLQDELQDTLTVPPIRLKKCGSSKMMHRNLEFTADPHFSKSRGVVTVTSPSFGRSIRLTSPFQHEGSMFGSTMICGTIGNQTCLFVTASGAFNSMGEGALCMYTFDDSVPTFELKGIIFPPKLLKGGYFGQLLFMHDEFLFVSQPGYRKTNDVTKTGRVYVFHVKPDGTLWSMGFVQPAYAQTKTFGHKIQVHNKRVAFTCYDENLGWHLQSVSPSALKRQKVRSRFGSDQKEYVFVPAELVKS